MANAIVGTLVLVGLGSVIGIPVGIFAGIYVTEYSKSLLANIIKFLTDVLSGIPSIIIGIFAYGLIVIPMQRFSALAGGFALGVLMIPTITRITEEMLKLVPHSFGKQHLHSEYPRWKTTLRIVLRTASGGIITGISSCNSKSSRGNSTSSVYFFRKYFLVIIIRWSDGFNTCSDI